MEWTYSPPNFLEEPLSLRTDEYGLAANDGKAVATGEVGDSALDPTLQAQIHNRLHAHFIATQVITHKPFDLSAFTSYRLHADGRKDVTLRVQPAILHVSAGNLDLVLKDAAGNVLRDTRAERIATERTLGELVHSHRENDAAAAAILSSYESAVQDPDNELIYLYEIRDAMAVRFGGHASAISQLQLSQSAWDTLGALANVEPLRQGRHRGRRAGQLRNATPSELEKARAIARHIIQRYFGYLDSVPNPSPETTPAL